MIQTKKLLYFRNPEFYKLCKDFLRGIGEENRGKVFKILGQGTFTEDEITYILQDEIDESTRGTLDLIFKILERDKSLVGEDILNDIDECKNEKTPFNNGSIPNYIKKSDKSLEFWLGLIKQGEIPKNIMILNTLLKKYATDSIIAYTIISSIGINDYSESTITILVKKSAQARDIQAYQKLIQHVCDNSSKAHLKVIGYFFILGDLLYCKKMSLKIMNSGVTLTTDEENLVMAIYILIEYGGDTNCFLTNQLEENRVNSIQKMIKRLKKELTKKEYTYERIHFAYQNPLYTLGGIPISSSDRKSAGLDTGAYAPYGKKEDKGD